jgi:YVTN family beta-propeller protein
LHAAANLSGPIERRPTYRRRVLRILCLSASVVVAALLLGSALTQRQERPTATKAGAPIRMVPVPRVVIAACRRAQARASYPILCPTHLPRASRYHHPGPPFALGAQSFGATVDMGYATDAVKPLSLNHPDEFLHFVIGPAARGVPRTARATRLGGRRGLLAPASGSTPRGRYFGNHVRFLWREDGIRRVATLHTFGEHATERLLGRIVRSLRPARSLVPYRPGGPAVVRVRVPTGPSELVDAPPNLYVKSRGTLQNSLSNRLTRIDTRSLATEAVRGIGDVMVSVAAGEGAIWAASTRHGRDPDRFAPPEVVRIDPSTARIEARMRLDRDDVASDIAAGAGSVWVALTRYSGGDRGWVARIDPQRLRVTARIQVGTLPTAMGVEGSSVWVVNGNDTVSRISTETNRVDATVRLGRRPAALAFAAGSVWVTQPADGTVARVDAASAEVVATIPGDGPAYGITADARDVWVALPGEGALVRIDRDRGVVAQRIRVGGDPLAVASDGRLIWVTMNSDGKVLRVEP